VPGPTRFAGPVAGCSTRHSDHRSVKHLSFMLRIRHGIRLLHGIPISATSEPGA
jgi:hypothetical protein